MSKSARRLKRQRRQSRQSRQGRRHRERPRPRPQPLTNRQKFQLALIETAMEEIRDEGKGCILCGEHAHNAGMWLPSEPYAEYLGVASDKHKIMVYALYGNCFGPGAGERVERVIMTRRRAELAARDAGLEIVDGIAYFQSPDDPERFKAAWDKYPFPDPGPAEAIPAEVAS